MKNGYTYLDNAATTKPSKQVILAMKPFLEGTYGNASSLHKLGLMAKHKLNEAREQVAQVLHSDHGEVIFTSGGTESVNLAIFGTARQYQLTHHKPGHIIVSSIEHEAVLESVKALQQEGWQIDYLPVTSEGIVKINNLSKLIKPETVLVSVMYANNETGAIQPITELGRMITGINKVRLSKSLPVIYFHTDACQAGGILELNVTKLKVDLLSLNGSKLNGPKGAGVLYKKHRVKLRPIIFGGGQEFGLRSGTENLANIVGLTTALTQSVKSKTVRFRKLFALQQMLQNDLVKQIKNLKLNGPSNKSLLADKLNFGLAKLPSTINCSIKNIEAESLMIYLDAKGFGIATGSACSSNSTDPSHVLTAMGLTPELAKSSIRISLSSDTTKSDLKKFVKALVETMTMLERTNNQL